jgi:(p)ppGpp synthase/HD superfamily hydrolase
MSRLVERAAAFAAVAHHGQLRKYTNEPYIRHPAAVVEIVRSVVHTDEMLAAAWLHDVVEDCGVSPVELDQEFGRTVAKLVSWLTDASTPESGNRAARKEIDRNHLSRAPAEAQTIKVADLIDNTKTITERDPGFASIYIPEKVALLGVLTRADPALIEIAKHQLNAYANGKVV